MEPGEHGIELLVKRIAHKMARTLPPSIQIEDLFQSGMTGWILAQQKYDETLSIPFNKFASVYVYGSILDGLRAGCWVPRDLAKSRRAVEHAKHELNTIGIYNPSESQIANQLNISIDKYRQISHELLGIYPDSLEDDMDIPDCRDLNEDIEEVFKWEQIEAAIDKLPILPRLLIRMHYNEDISIAEAARRLNIDEYQARKMLRETLIDLKVAMRDWLPPDMFNIKE